MSTELIDNPMKDKVVFQSTNKRLRVKLYDKHVKRGLETIVLPVTMKFEEYVCRIDDTPEGIPNHTR